MRFAAAGNDSSRRLFTVGGSPRGPVSILRRAKCQKHLEPNIAKVETLAERPTEFGRLFTRGSPYSRPLPDRFDLLLLLLAQDKRVYP